MNEKFASRASKYNDDGIPEAVYKMNSRLAVSGKPCQIVTLVGLEKWLDIVTHGVSYINGEQCSHMLTSSWGVKNQSDNTQHYSQ